MRRQYLTTYAFILLLGYFSLAPHAVHASCGMKIKGNGGPTSGTVCSIDAGTVEGVDTAANEADSTNTAVLTLTDTDITIAENGTLAAGSAAINVDATSSITITASGASYKPGNGIWIDDADADGWALTNFTLYSATASGRRRLGLMRSVSTADCNDAAGNYNLNNSCSLGDGGDSAVTISANKNINTETIAGGRSYADGIAYRVTTPSDSATSVARYSGSDTISNGIAAGDEVLLINLQGSSTDYADVGNYEFKTVSAVSASTITFDSAITKSFDGTSAANQKVIIQRVPNYTNLTINNGITLTASAYDGLATTPTGTAGYTTGIVAFRATGTVTITGSISTNALGYRGGVPTTTLGIGGESFCGQSTNSGGGSTTSSGICGGGGGGLGINNETTRIGAAGSNTGGAGGAGATGTQYSLNVAGGGGGGGYGSGGVKGSGYTSNPAVDGTANTSGKGGDGYYLADTSTRGGGGGGGGTCGSTTLSTLLFGSGGGSGATSIFNNRPPGDGGIGGGIIYITGATISITGSMSANGADGGLGTNDGSLLTKSGSGGGGAGGSIWIQGTNTTLGTSLVTASGGVGGDAAGYDGGAGGSGIIAVGATSVTGTTTPTYAVISTP